MREDNKHTFTSGEGGVDTTSLGCAGNVPLRETSRGLLDTGSGGLSGSLLLLLLLNFFRVAVEEHVHHDVPAIGRAGNGAAETEDFTGEHPPDQTNRVPGLVVRGDGDVDELEGGIGVAEGNHGDVDVGSLTDGLVINTGVGNDDEAGLLERTGDVVGE